MNFRPNSYVRSRWCQPNTIMRDALETAGVTRPKRADTLTSAMSLIVDFERETH